MAPSPPLPSYCTMFGKDETQTGLVIIYNADAGNLWAAPPCHWDTTLMIVQGVKCTYCCRRCEKRYYIPMGNPDTMIRMDLNPTTKEEYLEAWTALWLGVSSKKVKVKIS